MRNVAVNGSPGSDPWVRVLLVEDNDDHASLIARALDRARSARFVVERAATAAEALARVADGPWDALVLDHRLGDTGGLVLLERLREAGPDAPTLLLVSGGSEALAIRARGAHVDDYMPKQEALRDDVLARAVCDMQANAQAHSAPTVSPIRARAVVLVV